MAVFHASQDCILIAWLVFLTFMAPPVSAVVVDLVPDFGTVSCPPGGAASKACPRGTITYTCTTNSTGALVWLTSLTETASATYLSAAVPPSPQTISAPSQPTVALFETNLLQNAPVLISNLTVSEEFRDRAAMGAVTTVTIICRDNLANAAELTDTLEIAQGPTDQPSPPINVRHSPPDLCSGTLDTITVEWDCPISTGGTDITRYTVVVVGLRNYTVENGRSVSITDLPSNKNYTVFVTAENCAGESAASTSIDIFNSTEPDAPTVEDTPYMLDCSDLPSGIIPGIIPVEISWQDQNLSCPVMQVCVNCNGVNCTSECRPVSGNNPYRINSTVSGENYTVNLTLVNGIGYSEVSGPLEIVINPAACPPVATDSPPDLSSTPTTSPSDTPTNQAVAVAAVGGGVGGGIVVVLLIGCDTILFLVWWFKQPKISRCLEVTTIVLLIVTLFGIPFAIVILCCFKKTKKGQKDENVELKEPSPGSSPAPDSGPPPVVYADPNTIQREEFPGTQDVYTVPDKKKKKQKPEDHLPTYQDPSTITHEVAPTGDMYAQPDKAKKPRGSKKNQQEAPPHTQEQLAEMYSQPDKSKKQQNQGLTYTHIDFHGSGKVPDTQPGVVYSDVKPQ